MFFGIGCQYTFIEQSGKEPVGEVVSADQTIDMPAATFVIPGTQIVSGQKMAACVLRYKDGQRIDSASHQYITML